MNYFEINPDHPLPPPRDAASSVFYPYPPETLGPDDDDGTIVENVDHLGEVVIGRRIVAVERMRGVTTLVLDNGTKVTLRDTDDCCAFTELEDFLLHPESVRHMIMGVGTTDGYRNWHIYADFGDILELKVGWSCGNPFYYGYGFDIQVTDVNP